MIYTVTFNPAIDYVIHLSGSLKLGGINRNESEEFQYGGKGINVSRTLRALEMDSVAAEAAFAKFCAATEKELDVTVSVGIVEVDLTESIKTNYHRAVQQCYAVKERGGNGVQVLS